MELKRGDATVIAAEDARSAGLLDEDPLDLPAPPADGLRAALVASIAARRATRKHRHAVVRAGQDEISFALSGTAPSAGPERFQSVLAKPMPDGRLRSANVLSDLSVESPSSTSGRSSTGVSAPFAACLAAYAALRPCLSAQYPTVASCSPTRRPISASESPSSNIRSSSIRSMHRIVYFRADGTLRLSRASPPPPLSGPTPARTRARTPP